MIYLTYYLFVFNFIANLCYAEQNEENEREQSTPSSDNFPNFRAFYDANTPFRIAYPFAKLEPEKFAINEQPRNFPKEAGKRPLLYGEEEDITTGTEVKRNRRHIPDFKGTRRRQRSIVVVFDTFVNL